MRRGFEPRASVLLWKSALIREHPRLHTIGEQLSYRVSMRLRSAGKFLEKLDKEDKEVEDNLG